MKNKNETVFEKQLHDLLKELGTIPDTSYPKIEKLTRQTSKSTRQLKGSLGTLQESLDYLRVSVKYMVFDLEATRRENAFLKNMLQKMD